MGALWAKVLQNHGQAMCISTVCHRTSMIELLNIQLNEVVFF